MAKAFTDFEQKIIGNQKVKPPEKKETKGESFRKKIKKAVERGEEKKLPKRNPKNIMEIDKSLKNLKSDFRFPNKETGPRTGRDGTMIPEPKAPRKPGEDKEMQPLAKGGRAMYKSGMRVCKLAKRGKGRAYGKNS
jgi:hypothetical protein